MAKADVLHRVAADLSRGHTQPAIQRLGSLVAAHPADLDLRRRLAAAHRLVGNAVEAGRWSYLNADADPAETAAFERAYPSPRRRLVRLGWPARQGYPATEFARQRLAALAVIGNAPTDAASTRARATLTSGPTAFWRQLWTRRQRVRRAGFVAALVAAPFVILGASTVVGWIVR